ncbi:hypothetical protein N8371_08515 [Vicingaceae bacterium]|nr:hypothetical protein [Vicingaceae bacterium]MDC1452427.1 hypothetical protein [Vicingaceae bacterium]
MLKIAHIVNPVKVAKNNQLFAAQLITFESMKAAKEQANLSDFELIQCCTQYSADEEVVPSYFKKLSNLKRSVNEVNSKLNGRKLPLIKDILYKINELENTDYLIYTNIDIGLMPYFYNTILGYIKKGHDAIIVNKRRLVADYNNVNQLPDIYADLGKSHPGFDCFIFKRDLLEKFVLNDICVGVPFLGVSLLHNLVAHSQKPLVITNAHLTFHIGMSVLEFKKDEYYSHNKASYFNNIYPKIKSNFDLNKFPYSEKSFLKRMIFWMLNPSIFTVDYLNLERKNRLKKIKLKLDEIRWRILQR